MAALAAIPEEEIWLQKQKSPRTRRAYRRDVAHFLRTLAIATPAELRQVDHKAVIAWERFMRETEHAAPSTVRRRLAALSSLFKHLVRHGEAARNPVADVERPARVGAAGVGAAPSAPHASRRGQRGYRASYSRAAGCRRRAGRDVSGHASDVAPRGVPDGV
jgi:integrase